MSENRALLPRTVSTSPNDLHSLEQLRAPVASSARFPKSLKIAIWNCRGIHGKKFAIFDIFDKTGADLLVLNETFRRPNALWLDGFPPLLAEATSASSCPRRLSNGVAILSNPRSKSHSGPIRTYSVVAVDNVNGLKVVLKVNQFTIFAVYAPTSAGIETLSSFAREAQSIAASGQPVIFCGDLNAPHSDHPRASEQYFRSRARVLLDSLGPPFFRIDTGLNPTRPANRVDSVAAGAIIDHVYVANANGLEGKCFHTLGLTSDHRPIFARIRHHNPPDDTSVKYWRLNLEQLRSPEVKSAYRDAVQAEISGIHSSIMRACPVGIDRLSPIVSRQQTVDAMEKLFIDGIMSIAQRVIGRKAVPIVPSSGRIVEPPAEYRTAATSLVATYSDLRRFASLGPEHPRVSALLHRRDSLKAQLEALERSCQRENYNKWRDDLCSLPVAQRLKVLNRCMRRRSAAGACLSTTPLALDSYKTHFERQFGNEFGIAPFVEEIAPLEQDTEISIALFTFQTGTVQDMIMRSPAGKAPGASGMPAELLHPIAESIVPTLAAMFAVYMVLAVIPTPWKRALICPVPKKGDLNLISNYRPISLTEVTRKIFEMCMLQRLQSSGEISLSREQGGFRQGRSTIDQVQCLDKIVKFIGGGQDESVCMAFLDIKVAYDSVPRGELWRQCRDQGLEHVSLSCLRSLFDHNSAQLVVNQHRSSPFGLPAGVLQGSVLSPLLYSVYLDPLVEKLSQGPRMSLPHHSEGVNALLYADDIALIASTPQELRLLLQIAEQDSQDRGYRFSPSKCIVIGSDREVYRLYNTPLIRQSSFRYL